MLSDIEKRRLSEEDIRNLRFQIKLAMIAPVVFLITGIAIIEIMNAYFMKMTAINHALFIVGTLSFSLILGTLFTRKLRADVRNGYKHILLKTVQKKEASISHEAGSGTLHRPILGWLFPSVYGQRMKPVGVFSLIIDWTRYKVDKELFGSCEEGDTVEFHYAPISNFRIRITKE